MLKEKGKWRELGVKVLFCHFVSILLFCVTKSALFVFSAFTTHSVLSCFTPRYKQIDQNLISWK